jgi:hypothetical protein
MEGTVDPTALINQLSVEFDNRSLERHEFGQDKYGKFSFLEKDMFEEAIFECLDTSNYMRYQFIKLRMLQMMIASDPRVIALADSDGNVNIGADSFKKVFE